MPARSPSKPYDPAQDGWEVLWSRQLDEADPEGRVYHVAGTVLDGRDVVVAVGSDSIAVWDAAGGERLAASHVAVGRDEFPMQLAVVGSVTDPVALTGSSAGAVRAWDLRTGLPWQEPLRDLHFRIRGLSAAAADDRILALATFGRHAYSIYDFGTDGGVQVLDVQARRDLHTLRHSETTTAVAIAAFGGRACAVVAGEQTDPEAPWAKYPEDAQLYDIFGSLAVFDALTGEQLGPVTELGRNWTATALALDEVGGRLHAFAANESGGFQVVDVAAGQVLDGPSWSDQVVSVVTGGPPERPVVLVTGQPKLSKTLPRRWEDMPPVRLWDPRTGETMVEAPLRSLGQLGLTRAGQVIQGLDGEVRLLVPPARRPSH
jgi:hypothetical protein